MTTSLSDNMVLSPSGVCRTFDAKADGYGRGEAINVLYIKRLSSAKQANDPIRAVIRSTAVNYDGKTANISAPSVQSQESLIRNAYQKAGFNDLSVTAFFECHGTGTVADDAAETTAIDNCFKPDGVIIGALKPNFGHSEGASGITSLIKAILSLERSTIPPNFNRPFRAHEMAADRRQRVSINGFGIGGANAHVILDSAADVCGNFQDSQTSESVTGVKLLVVSAQGSKSLESRIKQEDILRLDRALKGLGDPPSWSLQEELCRTSDSRVDEAEVCQPLCTAIQIGLVNLLASWGVQPAAVVGHSSGEIAAAYAAGAISEKSAIILAYYRGKLAKQQMGLGEMASIGLSSEEVTSYLEDGVVIACRNSPQSVTLSGETSKIDIIVERIRNDIPDIFCRKLGLKIAYHSQQMKCLGPLYEASITGHLQINFHMLPMLSSVTKAMVMDPQELGAAYWRRNLESPVLFNDAVSNLLKEDKAHILLEISPHSALSGPLKQIFRSHSLKHGPLYIPTLKRCDDTSFDARCEVQLLSALGLIHSNGAIVDLMSVNGRGQVVTDLPPYPWQHGTRYWNESRLVRDWRLSSMPPHELLGSRCPESTDLEPSWRNIVGTGSNPWLADHILRGHVVFPAAGYIAMAGEAVRQLNPGTEGFTAKNVLFKSPLVIDETGSVEIITSLNPVAFNDVMNSEWYSFVIASHDGSVWTEVCSGQVQAGVEDEPSHIKIPRYARQVSPEKWYGALSDLGLSYGPQFRGLQNISADPLGGRASASVNLVKQYESHYFVHPTMLDQCLQLMSVAGAAGLRRCIIKSAIPSSIEHLLVRSVGEYMDVNVEVKQETGNYLAGDATAMFEDKVVLSMKVEDEVLKGLEICIMRSRDSIATDPGTQTSSSVIIRLRYTRPLSDTSVRLLWHSQDVRFAPYANIDLSSKQQPSDASSNILRDLTLRADRDPSIMLTEESRSLIIQETVRLVSSSLIGSQDLDEGQKWEIPIDSLASLEIKSWVRRNMDLDVSVAEIAKSRTVGGLALMTADRLVGHYKAKLENPSSGVLDEGTAVPSSSEVVD
ncbi:putative PKS/NRPS-like protein biosynthetic cluster [Aspergillus tubingensis]|nr:putative PKS/NRPS-like protein biosynthetic cluster [Aspergillus tubingensis]